MLHPWSPGTERVLHSVGKTNAVLDFTAGLGYFQDVYGRFLSCCGNRKNAGIAKGDQKVDEQEEGLAYSNMRYKFVLCITPNRKTRGEYGEP